MNGQATLDFRISQMFDFNTNSFVEMEKEEYRYNELGQQPIEIIKYNSIDGHWITYYKEGMTYNEEGRISKRVTHTWNESENNWKNETLITYHYNGSQLQEKNEFYWDNNWVQMSSRIYTYNEYELMEAENLYQFVGDEQRNIAKKTYAYNALLNLIEVTVYNQYPESIFDERTIYERDSETEIITKITSQEYVDQQWVDVNIIDVNFDTNNNLKSLMINNLSEDAGILSNARVTNIFDNDKLHENYYTPFEFTDELVNMEIDDNPFVNKITDQVISLNVGFWIDFIKIHYQYSDDILLGVEPNLNLTEFRIYPNPTNDVLTIKSSNSLIANLNLYDLNGRLVIQKPLQGLETMLNVEPLANGIYLLEIATPNGKMTKRISKQ